MALPPTGSLDKGIRSNRRAVDGDVLIHDTGNTVRLGPASETGSIFIDPVGRPLRIDFQDLVQDEDIRGDQICCQTIPAPDFPHCRLAAEGQVVAANETAQHRGHLRGELRAIATGTRRWGRATR